LQALPSGGSEKPLAGGCAESAQPALRSRALAMRFSDPAECVRIGAKGYLGFAKK